MKKSLLLIVFLLWSSFFFAQNATATLKLPDILAPETGEEILLPITLQDISSDLISAMMISIRTNDAHLTWNGTITNPATGVIYIHPEFTQLGGDWNWNNDLPNELAFWWVPSTISYWANLNPSDTIIVLSYTYNGGLLPGENSAIFFGEDENVKNATDIYDYLYYPFNLTFDSGSLYNDADPSATMSITDVDVDGVGTGEDIAISIVVDNINTLVPSFQICFEYDPEIIHWDCAGSPIPDTCVSYIHPNLTSLYGPDWLWSNMLLGQLFFSWIEPTFFNPVEISPGDILITLLFNYQGDLSPGQSSPIEFCENTEIGGISPENLTLVNGLIYNGLVNVHQVVKENFMVWPDFDKIVIKTQKHSGEITIHNLLGQIVKRATLKQGINEIPIKETNTLLIVSIRTSDDLVTKKVFIK